MAIEHELDERELEFDGSTREEGKTSPGNFGGAIEIEQSMDFAQVVVGFGLEVEMSRRPPTTDFDVGFFVGALRNVVGRQIRNVEHHFGELFVDFGASRIDGFAFVAHVFEFGA